MTAARRIRGTRPKSSARCKLCRTYGHDVLACPTRRPTRFCDVCLGMSHRRDGIRCSGCGGRFAHEPPLSVADILARPVADRRAAL